MIGARSSPKIVYNQTHNSTFHSLLKTWICCLGLFSNIYQYAVLNILISNKQIWSYLGIAEADQGVYSIILQSCTSVGAIGGCLMVIYLERLNSSRKRLMVIADMIGIACSLLMLFRNISTLIIGRSIFGLLVGINSSVVMVFVIESSPRAIKALCGSSIQIFTNLGIVASFLLGQGTNVYPNSGAFIRLILFFPGVFCALRLALIYKFDRYDSPSFYFMIDHKETAIKLINEQIQKKYVDKEIAAQQWVAEQNQKPLRQLFCRDFRNSVRVGMALHVLQQFSGINIIMFQSSSIIKNGENSDFLTEIVGLVNLLLCLSSGIFYKYFGRRQIFLVCQVAITLMIALLTVLAKLSVVYDDPDAIKVCFFFMMLIYLLFFQISLGPLVLFYSAEILPLKLNCLCLICNWLSVLLLTILMYYLEDKHLFVLYLICFCVSFAGIFFMNKYLKETYGKSLKLINRAYEQPDAPPSHHQLNEMKENLKHDIDVM